MGPTGTPTDRLYRAVVDFAKVVLERQANIAIFFREEKHLAPAALAEITTLRKRFDRMLSQLLTEGVAAGEFEVGGEAAVAFEIPFEAEWVKTGAVGGVGGLEGEEYGDCVDRIFEASAEKAGEVEAGEDPSVAQAGVEDAGVAASAGDGVAAAGPDFNFVATLLGAGLGEGQRRCEEQKRDEE